MAVAKYSGLWKEQSFFFDSPLVSLSSKMLATSWYACEECVETLRVVDSRLGIVGSCFACSHLHSSAFSISLL